MPTDCHRFAERDAPDRSTRALIAAAVTTARCLTVLNHRRAAYYRSPCEAFAQAIREAERQYARDVRVLQSATRSCVGDMRRQGADSRAILVMLRRIAGAALHRSGFSSRVNEYVLAEIVSVAVVDGLLTNEAERLL